MATDHRPSATRLMSSCDLPFTFVIQLIGIRVHLRESVLRLR
jgi:hypothetical protein